jgi:hypothetical protein
MKTSTLLAGVLTVTIGAGGYALAGGSLRLTGSDHGPITRTDLAQSASENAYDAVTRLRPGWLATDSARAGAELPAVYVEIPCTEVSCLAWLQSDQIEEVRFFDPDDTGAVWPPRHGGGAIVVTLRTRDLGGDSGAGRGGGSR